MAGLGWVTSTPGDRPARHKGPRQGPCLTQMSLDWDVECPPEKAHRSRAGCLHQNLPTFSAAPKTPSQ
eukprot:scaffold13737_cov95-Isochrysis_galbana.AAC.5